MRSVTRTCAPGRGRVEVAAADLPLERHVVLGLLVDLCGAILHSGLHVHHGVQHVIIDVHERRRIRGRLRAVGHHCGHRISNAAHLADRKGWMRDFLRVRDNPAAYKRAELLSEIVSGIYSDHAI